MVLLKLLLVNTFNYLTLKNIVPKSKNVIEISTAQQLKSFSYMYPLNGARSWKYSWSNNPFIGYVLFHVPSSHMPMKIAYIRQLNTTSEMYFQNSRRSTRNSMPPYSIWRAISCVSINIYAHAQTELWHMLTSERAFAQQRICYSNLHMMNVRRRDSNSRSTIPNTHCHRITE